MKNLWEALKIQCFSYCKDKKKKGDDTMTKRNESNNKKINKELRRIATEEEIDLTKYLIFLKKAINLTMKIILNKRKP